MGVCNVEDIVGYEAPGAQNAKRIFISQRTAHSPRKEFPAYHRAFKDGGTVMTGMKNNGFPWANIFLPNYMEGVYKNTKVRTWGVDLLVYRRLKTEIKGDEAREVEDMLDIE